MAYKKSVFEHLISNDSLQNWGIERHSQIQDRSMDSLIRMLSRLTPTNVLEMS